MVDTAPIDAVLRAGAERGEVPGIVAMAVGDRGFSYCGAFGRRSLPDGQPMTRDTVFRIASMTKAITSVAALQLVEAGRLSLDGALPDIDPALSAPQVLDGFDAAGHPMLRPARRPITLRRLLTHTAGFCYEMWNANALRYGAISGLPPLSSGKRAALRQPLAFDPGERWEYGIAIDWVGRLVEEVSGTPLDTCLRDRILGPLGMNDTGFAPTAAQQARRAVIHQRDADGGLTPLPFEEPFTPEFYAGGGGLFSTAADYLAFQQMLLNGGIHNGARIVKPETVALLGENHIGGLQAGIMKTTTPARSNDVDFFPGAAVRWGLAAMINREPGPHGCSADSLTWAGLFNTYYWLDPKARIAGIVLMQLLPFADHQAVAVYGRFERAVYDAAG